MIACQHSVMIKIDAIPIFSDNYIWLIRFGDHRVVIVDPGDANPVLQTLEQQGLTPEAILITHNCWDHVSGIGDILHHFQIPVYGPASENVTHMTHPCKEGDRISIGELALTALDVPGHTAGHIAFVGDDMLFCGDTLFGAGCGRLHNGTAAQLHDSLQKISRLPITTNIYCAHEYTLANLKFAHTVEPGNPEIMQRKVTEEKKRQQGLATLPSTLALELETNPFLRCHVEEVIANAENFAGKKLSGTAEVFKVLRYWKDTFS